MNKKQVKQNLKDGSNVLLKFLIPDFDLDWDGVYFILKDKKDSVLWKLKKQKLKSEK